MYTKLPTPSGEGDLIGKALIAAAANEVVEVWPENWPTFELFAFLSTQWRVGMAGRTGLDYMVLYRELDDLGLTGEERRRVKDDIREMELKALSAMNEE